MNCTQFHEHLLDMASADPGPGELQDHRRSCAACAAELASLRQTMTLLEEWQAPADTSPYFATRLRARLREEQAQPTGWFAWLRNPALAVTMAVLMIASITLFQGSWRVRESSDTGRIADVRGKPGTAIGDLQYLDKNHDLLADFELLDELVPQQSN